MGFTTISNFQGAEGSRKTNIKTDDQKGELRQFADLREGLVRKRRSVFEEGC